MCVLIIEHDKKMLSDSSDIPNFKAHIQNMFPNDLSFVSYNLYQSLPIWLMC